LPRSSVAATITEDRMAGKRWSQHVTETSDALDLKEGVFTGSDPKKIARSLKASAEHSDRRKSDPYRSAMSMLTFYINRAGHNRGTTRAPRGRQGRVARAVRQATGKEAQVGLRPIRARAPGR
jgi:hypothetical protein